MIKNKAFSLIEILMGLIMVSLLIGAFAPVITKKMKVTEIAVGNFSAAPKSDDDCEKFSVGENKCIMCSASSCLLCSSQIGDTEGYYVDPNETCEPKKCSDKFGNDCTNCNKNKCKSCMGGSALKGDASACEKCSAGYFSPGGTKNCEKCADGYISSIGSSSCSPKYCGQNEYLDGITCKPCEDGTYQTDSQHQKKSCSNCPSECKSCTSNTNCTSCTLGFSLINNKCIRYCSENEYFTGSGCLPCSNGTYQASAQHQNTSCSSCPTGCSACTSATNCTACSPGYTYSLGTCAKIYTPQTITINGIQVTKFNMGDDPEYPRSLIETRSGVKFVPIGTECKEELCCWYGQTGGNGCTDVGGIYSGCNRTVCKWQAGKKICESIGSGWDLPSADFAKTWYPTYSTASTGLMLCTQNKLSDLNKANFCGQILNGCSGAGVSQPYPFDVWTLKENGTSATYLGVVGSATTVQTRPKNRAMGIRCVK